MPVFYKDNIRVLFVHIPKCGGSYIEHLFLKNGFSIEYIDGGKVGNLNYVRKCSPQHMHYSMLDAVFNLELFDYVFTIVRDPIQRLMSEAHMRLKDNISDKAINDWAIDTLSKYKQNPFIYDNHIRPQVEFLFKDMSVFKHEDGFDDFFVNKLEENIGFKFKTREIEKVMSRKIFSTDRKVFFNDNVKRIIKKNYADDYRVLKYEL